MPRACHRRRALGPLAAVAIAWCVAMGPIAGCAGTNGSRATGSSGSADADNAAAPAQYGVAVVARYPHDTSAFTEGLVWAGGGELYESTGKKGQSSLRRVTIATGDVVQRHDLDAAYFGEGLALVDDQLVQLTWQDHVAFVYDASSFDEQQRFSYRTEGWGLCNDGHRLVMSDGTSTLTFRDPKTFETLGSVDVTLEGRPLKSLNELECVGGKVYANVFGDDHIYEIDPSSGTVTGVVDASGLYPEHVGDRNAVLNGIAFDPDSGHFYLTGKDWPTLFEVTFVPSNA